jgi:hypothetical protein
MEGMAPSCSFFLISSSFFLHIISLVILLSMIQHSFYNI